jgi:hypothetical protein
VKRIFRSPLPIRPDGLSSPAHFFIFLRWPSRSPTSVAHFGPSRPITGSSSTFDYRSHRRPPVAPLQSHTRMELNQSVARSPSLSRTSSAPHRLPSPIQCRNRRGLKIHRRQPPPRPIKGTPSTTAPHRTLSHFLLRLSIPPLAPHRAPPPPFVPLCRRPYLAVEPVAKDLGEVPRLPLFVLKPSQ